MITKNDNHRQFLFLNTLLPAAGGSAATLFFAAAPVTLPPAHFVALTLVVVGHVAFFVAVLALRPVFPFRTAFLVITVVALDVMDELEAAEWLLTWLTGRSCCCCCCCCFAFCCGAAGAAAGRAGGAMVLPLALLAAFPLDSVRRRPAAAVPAPRLACSTMPCNEAEMTLVAALAAVLSGETGLSGDIGRAR